MMCHFFPSVRWLDLTLRQFIGLLHRVPDIVGVGKAEPSSGDILELEWKRSEYGI